MFSAIVRKIISLPRPWNIIVSVGVLLLTIFVLVMLFNQISACNYDRGRRQFEERDKQRAAEIDTLKQAIAAREGQIAERDKRIAELEPKAQAFMAAAEENKRVSQDLADKVQKVSEEESRREEAAANSTDCRTRAQRVCDLFRSTDKRFDCTAIFNECGRAGQ